MRALALSLKSGSSPHVRGALNHPCGGIAMLGIIPACAGSTRFHLDSQRGGRDHPRMCGEHIGLVKDNISETGSSPHVRGALIPRLILITRGGIIPACAGSTVLTALDPMAWRDHSRMCGEHRCFPSNIPCSVGSSPHVRGARRHHGRYAGAPGIIPACAGSTDCRRGRVDAAGDHPRMCGEHRLLRAHLIFLSGSSPHVRGARFEHVPHRRELGIIPACAGSTGWCCRPSAATWDHPRMCGEHSMSMFAPSENKGSSPHVRGALDLCVLGLKLLGIIPACAGSTTNTKTPLSCVRDHPRMCGEHPSPKTEQEDMAWIIPACAGSTISTRP